MTEIYKNDKNHLILFEAYMGDFNLSEIGLPGASIGYPDEL